MTAELVISSFYDLRDPAGFDRAARLLVARLRLTGMEGVRSYRFLGGGMWERRLVAIFESAEAWAILQERITPWAESASLRASARVSRVDVFGTLSPAMRDWAEQLGLGRRLRLMGAENGAGEPVRRTGAGRENLPRLASG